MLSWSRRLAGIPRPSAACTTAMPSSARLLRTANGQSGRRPRPHRRDARAGLDVETTLSRPGRRSAGPWLFTIARRVLIASVERRRLETSALERLQVEHRETDVVSDERWLEGLDEDLDAALQTLPRDQRRALELRVVGGLSYAGVADRLGCSPTAARIRVSVTHGIIGPDLLGQCLPGPAHG